jgi:hypothetical protein
MGIILAPATRKNIEKSIAYSIDFKFAEKYLESELVKNIMERSGDDGIRCWGTTKEDKKLFDNVERMDDLLLIEEGTGVFSYCGRIIAKTHNQEFGQLLWETSDGNPCEYVYFLSNVIVITLYKEELLLDLGKKLTVEIPARIVLSNNRDLHSILYDAYDSDWTKTVISCTDFEKQKEWFYKGW